MIHCTVIHAAHRCGVRKLLYVGSACIYPREAPQPMREDYLLTGTLEPTNEAYAVAKIAGIKLCAAYRRQYGFNFVSVMPTNLYGPHDNFDLLKSHVLPSLIRKFHEAKLVFDTDKPDGMPRRLLDVSRLHAMGWRHRISLREGIASTYAWFAENYEDAILDRHSRAAQAPREAKLARLAEGESVLQSAAKRAKQRTDWRAHAGNVALNLAGAGFIFGFGREADAWESFGVGIGTLNILTAPKRGIQDLSDYETRFGMKTADRFNWSILPTTGGVALQVTY